jgi:hypothetical protein
MATYEYEEGRGGIELLPRPHRGRYLMGTWAVLPRLYALFLGQPGLTALPAVESLAAGEFKAVLAAGYRPAVGLFGSSLYHHVALDRPAITGPELLEPIAVRVLEVVRSASADSIE